MMNKPEMSPTRMVSLGIGAFALVGILAVGLSGGGWTSDSDEAAAIDTIDEGSGDSSSAEDERSDKSGSERAAANDEGGDEAWEEWVERPVSDSEDAESADEGEERRDGDGRDAAHSDSSGGDEEASDVVPDSE